MALGFHAQAFDSVGHICGEIGAGIEVVFLFVSGIDDGFEFVAFGALCKSLEFFFIESCVLWVRSESHFDGDIQGGGEFAFIGDFSSDTETLVVWCEGNFECGAACNAAAVGDGFIWIESGGLIGFE